MTAETPEASVAVPIDNTDTPPRLLHVYATPDGESHIREITVSAEAGSFPLSGLTARSYNPSHVDWHVAPRRQFAINLTGELRVETSDGDTRRIGPGDLVLLEDTHGRGHVTRLLGPVTCVFLHVDGDVDVLKWANP